MSLASWYLYKAEQCARMAKEAIDRRQLSYFETERKLWLEILEEEAQRDEWTTTC
jgi:hypothetical protein